jgi:hypothetical protein
MVKASSTPFTSTPPCSPVAKQGTSLVFEMLTPSELAQLQQHKRDLNAFGQKFFRPKTKG